MSRKQVVVVDDDSAMRGALARVLGAAGFEVRTYPTAEAFLENGNSADTGCLVLDIRLPGISGFDLYRRLVQRGQPVPVIFITARDDDMARAEAARLNAIAYFTKPFSALCLTDAISGALQLHPLQSGQ
jgi:FixJ family two-component response regulator